MSGLKHRDAEKQLDRFKQLALYNNVLPLTERACEIAANEYARLRKLGNPLDDIDLLIAGIALENKLAIATRNVDHFSRINNLGIQNWLVPE